VAVVVLPVLQRLIDAYLRTKFKLSITLELT